MKNARSTVALIDVPWDTAARPNPALSLLRALLSRDGIDSEVYFTNLWLADGMKFAEYERIAGGGVHGFFSEWLFAEIAFPGQLREPTAKPGEGFEQLLHTTPLYYHRGEDGGDTLEMLSAVFGTDDVVPAIIKLRDEFIPKFCRHVVSKIRGHRVLAFTCTLNQLIPALAIARLAKEQDPAVRILLGGVQVEGEMGDEVLRIAPWVDAVYKGEAEVAACDAIRWLSGEDVPVPEKYLSYRTSYDDLHVAEGAALVRDMSALVTPDYAPYFEQAAVYRSRTKNQLRFEGLPFISSRGCWYGEKRHCTFCGLNAEGMVYRERPAEAVVAELKNLAARHQVRRFFATDNIIPNRYFKTLLPQLADAGVDFEIFYETKANLKREQVELLKRAGVEWIQPGIESFNDHVLEIMRKGVTGIQNVYLLKLCGEYGILPRWNLIWGFPGEVGEDYDQQTRWMWKLFHLEPPLSVSRFGLQRFSPFHFESEKLGVKRKWAAKAYSLIYPKNGVDLEKIAFYYDFEYAEGLPASEAVMADYALAMKVWRKRWSKTPRPELRMYLGPEHLEVFDSREVDRTRTVVLTGLERDVLLACDAPTGMRALEKAFENRGASELLGAVEALEKEGLLIRDQRSCLALPVRWKPRRVDRRTEERPLGRSLVAVEEKVTSC